MLIFKGSHTFGTAGLIGTGYANRSTGHTWQTVISGFPDEFQSCYEGSLDGTNFFSLDSFVGTVSTMRHVVNKLVLFARGRVGTMSGASVGNGTAVITWIGRTENGNERDRTIFNKIKNT